MSNFWGPPHLRCDNGAEFIAKLRTTIPMSKKRRLHSPDLKAKVGLEALKGIEPVHAIAAKYQVHPVQVSQWKKEAWTRCTVIWSRRGFPLMTNSAGQLAFILSGGRSLPCCRNQEFTRA